MKNCDKLYEVGSVIKAGTLLMITQDLSSRNEHLYNGRLILLFKDTPVVKNSLYKMIRLDIGQRSTTIFLDECKFVTSPHAT
jgi:hypothetical protein